MTPWKGYGGGGDPVQHDDNFKLGILAAARAVDGSLDSGVEEL